MRAVFIAGKTIENTMFIKTTRSIRRPVGFGVYHSNTRHLSARRHTPGAISLEHARLLRDFERSEYRHTS